jgi:hypothetical protein
MTAPTTPATKAPSGRLVKATVARGRTVLDMDGKRRQAGAEIELPAEDVKRLRGIGFLVDPKAPVIPLADGPGFGSVTGPRIRKV